MKIYYRISKHRRKTKKYLEEQYIKETFRIDLFSDENVRSKFGHMEVSLKIGGIDNFGINLLHFLQNHIQSYNHEVLGNTEDCEIEELQRETIGSTQLR